MTAHRRNIESKRSEREAKIFALKEYNEPLKAKERKLLNYSIPDLVAHVHKKEVKPKEILLAYGKQAFIAQARCNPITEIMIEDAEKWANKSTGSLAGVPISFKDTVGVGKYDSTVGASKFCRDPMQDAPLVKLIKDAGAYPYVKTNIPFTLLSFESYNDIWGTTDNPHVSGFTPGGSSGGESALIAMGGSRIGVGTDVAGSVRLPAHFSGIYSLKPTTTRFPKSGAHTSMPGQEGIPSVAGPMARSLTDLSYFMKAVIDMNPWDYDYAVAEIPWKEESSLPPKLKIGVISTDTIVEPSPACARALKISVNALKEMGHECIEFDVPDPLEALTVGAQLLCSDGIETATSGMLSGEKNDVGVERARRWAHLPSFVRNLWAFVVEHWYGDKIWARLLRDFHKKTINERWALVARREAYREHFYNAFRESGVDFLLTVPNATPAIPHRGLYNSFSSCLYTFLFNIVDYPAGVIPVTKVDRDLDSLPPSFDLKKLNGVAKGAYLNYDAAKMHGLPVGVQLIGRRFREEDVLSGMALLEDALHRGGTYYKQIDI